jgi:hypothetical protein
VKDKVQVIFLGSIINPSIAEEHSMKHEGTFWVIIVVR